MVSFQIRIIAALAFISFAHAQTPRTALPPIDDAVLKKTGTEADPYAGSWLSYGKTQNETRFSPLKQIDTANVSKLGLAWSYVIGAGGGNQEGTPLMWNNTVYGITTWSVVYAVDARTGKEIWRWDPEISQSQDRTRICCGIVNRGLALYNGFTLRMSPVGLVYPVDPGFNSAIAW